MQQENNLIKGYEAVFKVIRDAVVAAAIKSSGKISFPYKGSFAKNLNDGMEKILQEEYNMDIKTDIKTDSKRYPVSCSFYFSQMPQCGTEIIFTEHEVREIYDAAWQRP